MFYLLLFVANYDSRQTRLGAIDFSLITLDREPQAASGAGRIGQRGLVALHFSELALFASQPDAKTAPDCPYRNRNPGNAD
jgi:hypothetical protein